MSLLQKWAIAIGFYILEFGFTESPDLHGDSDDCQLDGISNQSTSREATPVRKFLESVRSLRIYEGLMIRLNRCEDLL